MADAVTTDLSPGFRNEKHRAQWKMTLEVYAKPPALQAGGRDRHGGCSVGPQTVVDRERLKRHPGCVDGSKRF